MKINILVKNLAILAKIGKLVIACSEEIVDAQQI